MRLLGKDVTLYSIILIIITAIGVVLRLYKFPYVPEFTDEIRESLLAWDIYKFYDFPITNVNEYIGSLYLYALAIFMWITPVGIWTPRIFILIFGVLIIPLSYLMGKEWGNKRIGLLTALYVSLSPTLIILNSKISWSNCLTPLFAVLSLIQLKRSFEKINYKNVFLLGLVLGVGIQIHPTMLFFVLPIPFIYVGCLIWKLRFSKKLILYSLTLSFGMILGALPLVLINTIDPGASVNEGIRKEHFEYASLTPTASEYKEYISREMAQVKHLIRHSVIYDRWVIPDYEYYSFLKIKHLNDLLVLLSGLGLVYIFIKKKWTFFIPYFLTGCFLLLMPLFTTDYFEGLKIRYYSLLIPIFGLFIGYGLELFMSIKKIPLYIRYVIFSLGVLLLIFVPIRNLKAFSYELPFNDSIKGAGIDSMKLKELSQSYTIYYIGPEYRDQGKQYNIVEYLIKFGGSNMDNVVSFDKDYEKEEGNRFVIHKSLLTHRESSFASKVEEGVLMPVYEGLYINIYE